MKGSAEGWFHLVRGQINDYQDSRYRFIQKYTDRKSIERREKIICQDKPNWDNVSRTKDSQFHRETNENRSGHY